MDTQHLIALCLIIFATVAGMVVTTLSLWARDAAFFVLVAGSVVTTKIDVNFFSLEWYRGTTRGVEVTGVDVLAVCLIVACVLAPRYKSLPRVYWPGALTFMGLYALYCMFSVATSEPKIFGFFELTKVLRGIVVFLAAALFVRTRRELLILVFALGCVVTFEATLGVKQRYVDWIHRVGGTVEDPNSLSMYMCMVSPIFVAAAASDFPRWLKMLCWICFGAAALAILLTISRAGIPLFAMVMLGTTAFCISWKPTLKKAGVSLVILMMAGLALFKAWDMLIIRFTQATLQEEYLDDQNEGRGVYLRWARAIIEDHPFGVGLGNWSYWVSKVYGPAAGFKYLAYDDASMSPDEVEIANTVYAAPAHNLAALTAGELGLPGLFLFGLVWMRLFWMGATFFWIRSRDPTGRIGIGVAPMKPGEWGLLRFFPFSLVRYQLFWWGSSYRCNRSSDPMRRLGIGLFFCTWGIFLQSLTEWTYRQTPIFLTFHILAGTLASLHYTARQQAKLPRGTSPAKEREDSVIELEPAPPAMAREW